MRKFCFLMGCGSSQIIPEAQEEKSAAYLAGNGLTKKPHGNSQFNGNSNFNNNDEKKKQSQVNNKVNKFRTKIDPRVVAKYDIKALIGKGSFSRVVSVDHKGTKQGYAIKMIEVKAKEGRDVCESELRVLRRVRHQYIVQLIEVFEASDKIYMVMELATGGELFDRIIKLGSFTEQDAVKALRMLLEGMKYLHSLGITHRDLKPENLLYANAHPDSKLLITDFGLASSRRSGDDVTMKTTCGTPEYIAPEILLRIPYTNMVDCWALGVITYILLSGNMPFDDDNKPRLYRTILNADFNFTGEPWPQVCQAAKDFIRALLSEKPEKRMSCAQALRHNWITNYTNQSSRNLSRSISQNLLKRASSRNSNKSDKSGLSAKSQRSLRSQHRKVKAKELDDLLKKYNYKLN